MSVQPSGYLARVQPVSQNQVAEIGAENIKGIVKTAVAETCAELFHQASKGNELLMQFARGSKRYETSLSFDPNQDKTKTKLSVHKFFEDIKNQLPCIVIADAGCQFKSPGIGFHASVQFTETGEVAHGVPVLREIPVIITVATTSQQDTEKLSQALQMYWGDLVGLVHGYRLKGEKPGETWHIHLPKVPDFGTVDKTSLGDDPTKQIWSCITTLTCTYENITYITRAESFRADTSNTYHAELKVDFPGTIRIGRWIQGRITGLQHNQRVVVSDANLATLAKGPHGFDYRVLVKKPGTFALRVITHEIETQRPEHLSAPQYKIVLERVITATY